MKPTNNRIYCPACQHAKILFETKEKALRFLRYNADEIQHETGKRPVRAYYCTACGGWHVTSRPKSYDYTMLTLRFGAEEGQKIYDQVSDIMGRGKCIATGLSRKIKALRHNLKFQYIDIQRCQSLIEELIGHFEIVIKNGFLEKNTATALLNKFSATCNLFMEKKQLQNQIA